MIQLQKHVTIFIYLVQLITYLVTWLYNNMSQSHPRDNTMICAMKCKYEISVKHFQKGSLGLPFHPRLRLLWIIKSRVWYGPLLHACEKCYEWPGRASVNLVETLCVMEICMGVKKCYESHGCVSVHQNIWMTVNPTAVPPSWLEDMADWRSSQSANKNWVTHTDGQPTVLLNAYQDQTWNGLRWAEKLNKKIKFGSFAVNWTFRGETGHRNNVARNGSFTSTL